MSLQRGRLVWAIFLSGVIFLVIYFPADDHFIRLIIDLLVLLATGTVFLAVRAWASESARARGPVPVSDSFDENSWHRPESAPVPALAAPGRRIASAARYGTADGPPRPSPNGPAPGPGVPADPAVPRFGAGSKAQRFPWLLPVRPAAAPGLAADEASLGDLTVRAASLVGPGHRCQEPAAARQDAYRIARDAGGDHLLIAVADGVSSSTHAELGAAVAAGTAVGFLRRRLDEPGGVAGLSAAALFEEAATAMDHEARRRGLQPADVCSVLFALVVPTRPDAYGERTLWAAWLGDASLWRLHEERWRYTAGDRKGADAGYESNALHHTLPADPHAARETRLPLRRGDVLSLVSDGVGDGLATIEELNAYLAGRWARPLPAGAYLSDIGFDAERFLDDRTSVTVWVAPGGGHERWPR
jgi:serine/threonine protein phosphatase PrpC